ncbi:TrmH family RNA methyltransferase, partial [Vibrio vulnificus]
MQKARNSSNYKYQSRQRTQNSHERIDLLEMEDLTTNLDGDVEIVCVELVVGATALPHFAHPEKAIYLF